MDISEFRVLPRRYKIVVMHLGPNAGDAIRKVYAYKKVANPALAAGWSHHLAGRMAHGRKPGGLPSVPLTSPPASLRGTSSVPR